MRRVVGDSRRDAARIWDRIGVSSSRDAIPSFVDGVRLRRLPDRTVLLVPEGVVNLNASAAATLGLVDGARSCSAIAQELSSRYDVPAVQLRADVDELVDRLSDRGWLCVSKAKP
ncbi:MAG: pyrroloquinoline quinone biosynthesis peptide chaperone PqqD [Candidatus Eremiobacteraeota bacterium]|nr:pyrroloquinoline quinone biosynthesis peptide chaperone PqqD [Candidatus Eremiobacteraeota bacterium]MBV8367075.1 pyrroloquinoline quinone biosynthesis peptide chaperone PqqD [Candidatus Eremiobacteraeota bacterium]